jgi:hypothetical protein
MAIDPKQDRDAARGDTANAATPAPLPAPKPLTVPESIAALRAHVLTLQGQLARGSKSDLDQVGERLTEIVAWIDAVLDDKHHNPGTVRHINLDPVAEYNAEKAAAKAA